MANSRNYDLVISRKILKVLMVLNPIGGFLILGLLVASVFAEGFMIRALIHEHGAASAAENHMLISGMRWIMVLGVVSLALLQLALRRILAIVDTVSAGDPFVLINAERLKTIAWIALTLEVLHFVIGMIALRISTAAHPLDIDIDMKFNFTRWLGVLLLFVLARVFEQGARMRDDLEGTV
jgi:hypothetical protein